MIHMPDEYLIKLTNVSKSYNESRHRRKDVLKNISLDLSGPGMVFLVGESASGKTTLLNLIGALEPTSGGVISINGLILDHMTSRARKRYRVMDTGFGFQDCRLFPEMSVIANVQLAIRFYVRGRKNQTLQAMAVLKEFDLESYAHKDIEECSKGQKRRLALSRVCAISRKVYLIDDPTFRLDETEATLVMNALRRRAMTSLVIVATQDNQLAERYGDRIIHLENGCLVSDTKKTSIEEPPIALIESAPLIKHPSGMCHIVDFFRLVFGNLGRMLGHALVMLVIMAMSMTIIESTAAIIDYDSFSAYQQLVDRNEEYLIQITQYLDQRVVYPYGVQFYRGPDPEENYLNDTKKISEKIKYRIPVYAAYFYNRTFEDFFLLDQTYLSGQAENYDEAMHFTDILIVDDFIQFYQPLRYGTTPKLANEVLIYDYMAERLLEIGVIPEADAMSDLIGFTMTDRDTGFAFTISGIIKSRYSQHRSLAESDPAYDFASEYLAQRQSVVASPAFLDAIKTSEAFLSILGVNITTNGETTTDSEYRKLEFVSDLDEFNIIGDVLGKVTNEYILISDYQLAELLDVPRASITSEFINTLDIHLGIDYYQYNKSTDRSRPTRSAGRPFIVYQAESLDSDTLQYLRQDDESMFFANGEFRGMFLSLSANKTVNKKVYALFQWPKASDPFYDRFTNYIRAGYAEYTPYRHTILSINTTQDNWVKLGKWFAALALLLTVTGVIAGSIGSIRRNRHHIKVLKSFGISNVTLTLILFVDVLIVLGLAFAVSYFLATLPIEALNEHFLNIYNFELVSIKLASAHYWQALIITSAFALLLPVVAIAIAMAKVPLRTVSKVKS